MPLSIAPAVGKECTPSDPTRDFGKDIHFHLDGKGYLRAFLGTHEECPDARKRRAFEELHRPRSM